MPAKKDHHFVPQFYLRNFGDGDSIAFFNPRQRRHVPQASIAGQCQRPYLYGDDGVVEDALALVESAVGAYVRRIIDTEDLPAPECAAWIDTLGFIAFQQARTLAAGATLVVMREKVNRAIERSAKSEGAAPPTVDEDDDVSAALTNLRSTGDTGYLLQDLDRKLLVNESSVPFITSDSPVVLFNRWCQGWKHSGVLGFACAGLELFLPLSPRRTFFCTMAASTRPRRPVPTDSASFSNRT
jgi:uncharacterized protein DUF4238